MLNYDKLSKSTRTRTALLLLLLFMVLAVADMFISFFGGLVLGVLLVQFELEVQRFFNRSFGRLFKTEWLLKHYRHLSSDHKILFKAGLQVLITLLIVAGVMHTFWGGVCSGILLALLTDDVIRYRLKRIK